MPAGTNDVTETAFRDTFLSNVSYMTDGNSFRSGESTENEFCSAEAYKLKNWKPTSLSGRFMMNY
jgi:hypothetical protein